MAGFFLNIAETVSPQVRRCEPFCMSPSNWQRVHRGAVRGRHLPGMQRTKDKWNGYIY